MNKCTKFQGIWRKGIFEFFCLLPIKQKKNSIESYVLKSCNLLFMKNNVKTIPSLLKCFSKNLIIIIN
jgi:hypothetical protein